VAFLAAGVSLRASGDGWLKLTAGHFTILTPAGETAARRWAVELEEFRRGLQAVVPVPEHRLRPVTVVLFKNDRAMQPYLPLERGGPARVGGLFVRANDLNTIMLSLARDAAETRHVIFHEAVHWYLAALEGHLPLWLGEGLAELYATFELPDAEHYRFGAAIPHHVTRLRLGTFLPFEQLLGIDRGSLLYNEGTRASMFYAQSWAFVHFLFHGEDSPGPGAVAHYLGLLRDGHAGEAAFAAAFGGDYIALEKRLRRHVNGGTYVRRSYRRLAEPADNAIKVVAATPADLALARGSLLLGTRTPEDAEPHLRLATALAPADARAWELLGHIAIGRRDHAAAGAMLARAAAAGSSSYLVYHNLAVSRLPDRIVPGVPGPAPSRAEIDAAAADYRHAIHLAPSHVPSYEGLAGLIFSMTAVPDGDLALLARGLAASPGNALIETGLAAGELRAGRHAEGRARLERIVAGASPDDVGVQFARRILAGELLRVEMGVMDDLVAQRRFDAAIELADRALERRLEPAQRQAVAGTRRQLVEFKQINDALTLANDGDLKGARELLEAVLASQPHHGARSEARRLLREIARREEMLAPPVRN
jgi:tetratricopeptide (TPR) repeat protein